LFFLTIAASWAVLVPGKLWTERRGDAWTRRILLMLIGAGVGLVALLLDGWTLGVPLDSAEVPGRLAFTTLFSASGWNEAAYFSYFGLAFFALRWWRMTDRRRTRRFSLFPLIASAFWAFALLLLCGPTQWYGIAALVLTSAVVQLSSPWEQPPAAAPKKLRLRYA
jgi:hypothetical protein